MRRASESGLIYKINLRDDGRVQLLAGKSWSDLAYSQKNAIAYAVYITDVKPHGRSRLEVIDFKTSKPLGEFELPDGLKTF